jgi:hypothetical protein
MAEQAISRNLHLFGLTLPEEHAASRQALWQRLMNGGEVTTTAATGQTTNTNAAGRSAPHAERAQAPRRNYLRNTSLDESWTAARSTSSSGTTAVDPADGSTVQEFQNWDSVADRSRSTTDDQGETVGNFEAQLMLSEGVYFWWCERDRRACRSLVCSEEGDAGCGVLASIVGFSFFSGVVGARGV